MLLRVSFFIILLISNLYAENLNYKYIGQYIDWYGSANSKQKITDVIDLSLKVHFR